MTRQAFTQCDQCWQPATCKKYGCREPVIDDNSKLFAQPRVCLDCEETFTLGEMYPGKRYADAMQCPYCRSDRVANNRPDHQ